MRRARANHGRQAAVAAAMVAAAVIDAATADNAAAVNRLNPLIIFVKAVAPATAFLFHHGCARLEERTTIKPQRFKEGVPIMPDDTNAQENIEIPPIPKETAGAVTGAVIGSMIGPVGTVVGGIAGAIAGKAAGEGRLRPAAKKAVANIVKPAPARRRPKKTTRGKAAKKKPVKSRKRSTSKRTKAKPRRRSTSRAKKRRRR